VTRSFEETYQGELVALRALFGEARVSRDLPRLGEIHEYTETKWHEYAALLRDDSVRYLLIAEAPPWSPDGPPQFLLDPGSRVRTLMRALQHAFPGCEGMSPAESLQALALRGFLLIDSIPFAMKYSSRQRASERYDDLVRLTATSYLQRKVQESGLTWSRDLRIAFSLRLNALSICKAIRHLSVGGRMHPLSPQMIAVNTAGYPDARRLRDVYGLSAAKEM
jgi:hypothetical protein